MHHSDTRLARARLTLQSPMLLGGLFCWEEGFVAALDADPRSQRYGRDIAYLTGRDRDESDDNDMGQPSGLWVRFAPAPRSPLLEGEVVGTIDGLTADSWGIGGGACLPTRILAGPRPPGTDGQQLVYWRRTEEDEVEVRTYVGGDEVVETAGCHTRSGRQPMWMFVVPCTRNWS